MNYSIDAFEQLQDITSYISADFLKCPLNDNTLDQVSYLNGSFCFLLDRMYFKENAGPKITEEVIDSLLLPYDKTKMSDLAIYLDSSSRDPLFLKSADSMIKYYNFLKETETYVESAEADEIGLLTLAYLSKLSSLIEVDTKIKGIDSLKVNEVIFLNLTYTIGLILKGFLKEKFVTLKSFDYFDEVSIHAERIRTEILD